MAVGLVARPRAASIEAFAELCGLTLEPFQRRIVRAVAGGEREVVVLLPRGNGKTALMALIALHHLVTVEDARVVVVASSRQPWAGSPEVPDDHSAPYARALGMSVQRHREAWKVRWREGGRHPSRSFKRKGDADLFDAEIKRRQALGPHLMRELDRSVVTLDGFVRGGFRAHAATLSANTRRHYAWALENHLTELLDEPLVALNVPRLAAHQRQLLDGGRSANTVRAAMTRLSGILQAATEHGLISANPVRGMRKVPADPAEDVRPLSPVELERVIGALDGRGRAIALLGGHLGLRPLEARTVPWSDFDGRTLTIRRARTKRSAARTRVIDVPAVTARELRAWQLESGGRGDEPIVGPLGQDGLRLWAYKYLDRAARRAVGRDDVTLYTLRHSHASALHYCGWTVPDAAERLGHSPVVHMGIYAHPIKVIGAQRFRDLDDLIAEARGDLECPQSAPGNG